MKNVLSLILYPAAVLGAAITRAEQAVPSGPFAAGVWKPATGCADPAFLGTLINASGGKFYINRNTSTYCPDGISGLDCSAFAGTGTTLIIGEGSETMSLKVTVPGGQQAYIAPDGSLSYTQAHSAYMPPGSTANGFSRVQSQAGGAPVVLNSAGRSWYLCPVTEGAPTERTYQIFASAGSLEDCLRTEVRTYSPLEGNVWQYA